MDSEKEERMLLERVEENTLMNVFNVHSQKCPPYTSEQSRDSNFDCFGSTNTHQAEITSNMSHYANISSSALFDNLFPHSHSWSQHLLEPQSSDLQKTASPDQLDDVLSMDVDEILCRSATDFLVDMEAMSSNFNMVNVDSFESVLPPPYDFSGEGCSRLPDFASSYPIGKASISMKLSPLHIPKKETLFYSSQDHVPLESGDCLGSGRNDFRRSYSPINCPRTSQMYSSSVPVNRVGKSNLYSKFRIQPYGSTSSIHTAGDIFSPGSYLGDSQDDTDQESDSGFFLDQETARSMSGKEQYFWQYNVQAKGPKGTRLQLCESVTDPYQMESNVDPVFASCYQGHGVKHSGKARRGDGNDLTPNPQKLLNLRFDLEKLNKRIDLLTPLPSVSVDDRFSSRREKNKLASRACRLKKKAQHEAYKIQLAGLAEEHKVLTEAIAEVLRVLQKEVHLLRVSSQMAPLHVDSSVLGQVESLISCCSKIRVSGHLADYVQDILDCQQKMASPTSC